jgi:uncharacterized protein YjgD (DUF1641 family)
MTIQQILPNREDEVQRLFMAVSEALTDQMVERLSTTGSNSLEVIDRLNDEDTREAVLTFLDQMTALHRAGGLVAMFEIIHMLGAIRNALTDPMIERLTTFLENTVNTLSTEAIAGMAEDSCMALRDARAKMEDAPQPRGGIFTTLRMLSEPETQHSLRFLLAFASQLQKGSSEE